MDAVTACPFSIKKCAKMSVFYVKTARIHWPPDPLNFRWITPRPPVEAPSLPNYGCATACNHTLLAQLFPLWTVSYGKEMVDHGSFTTAFVCFLNFPFFLLKCPFCVIV